ncbi:MAG: SMP-30/gluconolactonase/LRE family protein [Bacteroidota bacterium]
MNRFLFTILLGLIGFSTGCLREKSPQQFGARMPLSTQPSPYQDIGKIERLDEAINDLIPIDAKIEILAEGFDWSEGPLWVPDLNGVIFSDIPPNTIYLWQEGIGHKEFLKPSGYTQEKERGGEVGSNGLLMDPQGKLILCQHGDRRLARMEASWDAPGPSYITVADKYDGKQFNSPNDAALKSNGDIYFTDPPYGLEKNVNDPAKEIDFQGVYRVSPEGMVTLLTTELSRPNGIAFSPDESTLYVANSDPEKAIWMAYDVAEDGTLQNGQVFFDATAWVGKEKGLPDGLKVDIQGNIFATGPGGVWVFTPEGKHLGTIKTTQATSNCAFGDLDGSFLYMTADMYLLRVKLLTNGWMLAEDIEPEENK